MFVYLAHPSSPHFSALNHFHYSKQLNAYLIICRVQNLYFMFVFFSLRLKSLRICEFFPDSRLVYLINE